MKNVKLWIAVICAAVVLAGGITAAVLLNKDSDGQNANTEKGTEQSADSGTTVDSGTTGGNLTVNFSLPGQYASLKGEVVIPEKTEVEQGTLIADLSEACADMYVFTGWYYDEGLTLKAGPNDTVNENLTLYPSFDMRLGMDTEFSLNYISSLDVEEDFTVIIASAGLDKEQVQNCLSIKNITRGGEESAYILKAVSAEEAGVPTSAESAADQVYDAVADTVTYYSISAPDGSWDKGTTWQVELLDTTALRFVSEGELQSEKISYYNFTVPQEEMNNLVLNDMLFIPLEKVSGVTMDGGLYDIITQDGEAEAAANENSGIMTYDGTLSAGETVAVYDGTLNADGTVDGDVTYINITKVLGTDSYAYESAGFTDVIFVPDIIPIKDDGSFGDLTVSVKKSELDFSKAVYEQLGLDETTVVEQGDYIAFYTGSLEDEYSLATAGYGLITAIDTDAAGNAVITYSEVTADTVMAALEMYARVDNVDVPVTEESIETMRQDATEQLLQSGFVEDTRDYVMALLTGEEYDIESSEFSEELKKLSFSTDTGEEVTLDELRLLAGGSKKCKISDGPSVSFAISPTLQHYEGKGVRLEVSVGFTIEIELNSTGGKQNKLEIKLYCAFEQEVVLGLDVKTSADWKWYAFIPVLQEVHLTASFRAGTYTGFGASATVMTGSDNDSDDQAWDDLIKTNNNATVKEASGLIKMGEKLENISKALKTIQNGGNLSKSKGEEAEFKNGDDDDGAQYQGVGGSLEDKYSSMLENDAEYINLVNIELFKVAASPDPFHLIEFSLEADFVVSLKVNAMIGFGVSYGNAKQYCFNVAVFSGEKSTSQADLETPNFRADAYAFGMIGLRAGVQFDARIGILSTKMDSIGITAEAGFYAEVYGFLYMSYTWESGKGSDMQAMGSLYFEMGTYVEINFVAQIGEGKLSKDVELYSNTWPFLKMGAEAVPLDFEIEEDDDSLTIEITDGKNSVKMPDEVYSIRLMSLTSGEVEAESQDSSVTGDVSYSFVIRGREYTQYNEENFIVTCYDLKGGKDGEVTSDHSFQYNPATNEIYVKPVDQSAEELWGIITLSYRNTTFGFNTKTLSRNIYVHWQGKALSAEVEYYVKNEDGEYDLFKKGEFSGFDGIQYDLVVDEDFCNQIEGYRLANAEFVEEEQMKEICEGYLETYENTYKLYQKLKVTQAQFEEAYNNYIQAYETYNNYGLNINSTIKNQSGTLYFLMTSPETIVKLYFDPIVNTAAWMINPRKVQLSRDGEPYTAYCIDVYKSEQLLKGDNVFEAMPDSVQAYTDEHSKHSFTWYYYQVENETADIWDVADHVDSWVELTADTVMPDCYVAVIGVEENRGEYTLSWSDGEQIIDSMEVMAGDAIPDHDAPEDIAEGRYFMYWAYSDGDVFCMADKMPEGDLTLFPRYGFDSYNVVLYYEGISGGRYLWHTSMRCETVLLDGLAALNDWPVEPGLELNWYLSADGREVQITEGMTMPAADIEVYGRYETVPYTLTLEDGTETTTLSYRKGETVVLPEGEDENGLALGWMYEGEAVTGAFTMPGYDCVLTANWHTHSWETVWEEEGDCLKAGVRYVHCTECTEAKEEETELNPDRHRYGRILKDYAAATCVTDGLTGNWYCNGCGALLETGEVIEKTGEHDLRMGEILEYANCVHGTVFEYYCKNCDYTEERDQGDLSSYNHEHLSEGVGAKEATCSEEGYTGDTVCEDCNETVYQGEAIAKLPHNTVLTNTKEATCTEEGYTGDYVCADCGEVVQYGETIDKLPHNKVLVGVKDATCTEEGYTGDFVCEDCGEVIQYGEVVEKCAHRTETVNAVSATCTSSGYTGDEVCLDCGAMVSYGSIILAKSHNGRLVGAKDPTYTEDGYTGDLVCSVCGKVLETGETIPKLEHNYGDFVTIVEPTLEAPGLKRRTCLDCGAIDEQEIPQLTEYYTVIYVNDLDGSQIEKKYAVDVAAGLDASLFNVTGKVLENYTINMGSSNPDGPGLWLDFDPDATITWDSAVGCTQSTIYLPELAGSDRTVTLEAVHSTLYYTVIYHVNYGTDALFYETEDKWIFYGQEENEYNKVPDATTISAAGVDKTFVGWALSATGTAFLTGEYADYPRYDDVQGGVLHLYAVWE